MPEIIPIRDLKNTNAISQRCHETQEPIFVTKSGYRDMVIMSIRAPRMLSGEFLFMATPHNSRLTMRVPQPDIIEHFGNADAVPQPPERCLSRQAGIVRCCLKYDNAIKQQHTVSRKIGKPVCCCFYLERGNGEIGTKRVWK